MSDYQKIIEMALAEGRTSLSEFESKQILRAYDIPTAREIEVKEKETFLKAVHDIGFPLVIKGCSPHLSHKSEEGLVKLDIRNEKEANDAYQDLSSALSNKGGTILVQEMVSGSRELMVGMTRDPQFGPSVMFALGGIYTEILKDTSFRVAPLTKSDALEMMKEIRGHRIIEEIRGMPAADLDQFSDILIKVGQIGLENEAINEIDINPIILSGGQPIAVDALIILSHLP